MITHEEIVCDLNLIGYEEWMGEGPVRLFGFN